jgi:hypothetical protein
MSTKFSKSAVASLAHQSAGAAPRHRDQEGCEGMASLPPPTKEHAWLQQFVGEWECQVDMFMGPDQPPMTTRGGTKARLLGGFWLIEEGRNHQMPYEFVFSLGFSPEKKKYVGTWTDSMMSYHWHYEGTVDTDRNMLTLETNGPFPMIPGKTCSYRDTTEFKSPDHRVFTSLRSEGDGVWVKHLVVTARRKK